MILDMSGSFLLMMLLYLWPMLLLVVGWINSLFRSLSKFNLRKLQYIQNSAARIVSNTSRYTSITPVLKKLHWLPVEHCSVFKTTTLFISFSTLVFPSILLHTSLPTAVPTVPGAVRMVVISLSFPSFNPQPINLSNSLVIVLLLMLPLFGMFGDSCVRLSCLLQKTPQNLPLPKHTLLSLSYPWRSPWCLDSFLSLDIKIG